MAALKIQTLGAQVFDPDLFFENWQDGHLPRNGDLKASIITSFNLKPTDNYVYHATASVTLDQVQAAVNAGREHGLHAWYTSETGEQVFVS